MENIGNLLISGMVSGILTSIVLGVLQGKKFDKNSGKYMMACISLTMLITGIVLVGDTTIKIPFIFASMIIVNFLVFNRSTKESIIFSLLGYSIIFLAEIFSAFTALLIFKITINTSTIDEYFIILHILISAFTLILLNGYLFAIRKTGFKSNLNNSNNNIFISYLGVNLLIVAIAWVYYIHSRSNGGSQFFSIMMVLVFFLTNIALILFQSSLSMKVKLLENMQEDKAKQDMYICIMEQLMDNIKGFKHDYKNTLRTLKGYVEDGENDEAMSFLKTLLDFDDNEKILQYYDLKHIKDSGIKALIISKVSEMIDKKLNFRLHINGTIESFNMKIEDLSRVIGVFIDNGIEASLDSEEKLLVITMIESSTSTDIAISNSFNGNIEMSSIFNKGFSTKGENRGLGLYGVKKIIDSYNNVTLTTNVADGNFTQIIEILK